MTTSKRALVSIIIPAFNSEKFIARTIESVQEQTYTHWELIITDDSSSDKTVTIIREFQEKDSRIKLYENTRNYGAAITRNRCLENATGRFIAFLDSDDLWFPNKLEIQVNLANSKNIPISFTSYQLINEVGEETGTPVRAVPQIDYRGYLKNTIIGMSTTMIDREIVSEEFSFVNIRTRQDTYLWITLLKRGHIAFGIEEVLASYRVRQTSISANKLKAAKRVWYLYYNLEKLGFFKAVYYFSFYAINALKKRI